MNVDYFSSLKADSKPRYRQELDLVGLKDYPYRLPAGIWCDNPRQWTETEYPETEYPDIHDYLINTPGKSERATQFLVSLFEFSGFSSLKRFRKELQIIVAKKVIVEFWQIIGFWLLWKLAW